MHHETLTWQTRGRRRGIPDEGWAFLRHICRECFVGKTRPP
jgi:hypothetical protein